MGVLGFLGLSSLQMKMINEGSVFGSWKHLQKKIRCQIPHSKKIAIGKEVKSFDSNHNHTQTNHYVTKKLLHPIHELPSCVWSKTFVLEKLQFDDNLTLGLIEALSFLLLLLLLWVVSICLCYCWISSKQRALRELFAFERTKQIAFAFQGTKTKSFCQSFCQSFAFERALCAHTNAIVILVFY